MAALNLFRWSRAASCETVRYIGLGSSSRCTPAAHPPSGAVAGAGAISKQCSIFHPN